MSLTIPSVEELPTEEGLKWAQKINNYLAEVVYKYPGRFYAAATLPLQDVNEAVKEMDRSFKELRVRGITMFSNVNLKPLSSEEFHPIYARAEEYGLPIFIHPAVPFTEEIMNKHKLNLALYGFTLDTSMAVISLIWQGVLEKYPGLNLIHAHLGGVVPNLVQGMEDCWQSSYQHLGLMLQKPPSEYYKSQVYPDSISSYLPTIKCCLDFVRPKHLCLGTDYAHSIGNWEQAVSLIKKLGLSREDSNDILGGNAARLFKID